MKIRVINDWPTNSTRFVLPTIAIRGFAGARTVTLAWWVWRVVLQ